MEDVLLINGRQYYIYGDSAYLLWPWMVRQFMRELATLEKLLFNTEMISLRIIVEHNYRDLKQLWTLQDYVQNLKVCQAHIGILYRASAIMLNFHTCVYKSGKTMDLFALVHSSIDDYNNSQQHLEVI